VVTLDDEQFECGLFPNSRREGECKGIASPHILSNATFFSILLVLAITKTIKKIDS